MDIGRFAPFGSLIILSLLACKKIEKQPLYKDDQITILELTDADKAQLASYRTAALKLVAQADPGHEQDSPVPLISIQRAVDLVTRSTDPNAIYGLGVLIGDNFVHKHKMQWLVTQDQYGRDPVVFVPQTVYSIGALTIVSKRIEDGQHLDVQDFVSQVEKHMKENLGQYKTY
jgi:hypothetical protein